MESNLRPLTLGEILDRTAQLYRSRFLVFLGISLVPTGVALGLAFVAGLAVAWWSWRGAASFTVASGYALIGFFTLAGALVALPILLAATALAAAAMNHAVSRNYLGESATIRDSYKTVWRRGWRYSGLYLLQVLIIGAAPIGVWTVLVFLAALIAVAAKKLGMGSSESGFLLGFIAVLVVIALIGYAIWMLLRLSLAFPACVVEQIGAWPAIKRSSALSKGTKGRIFLLYLLVGILGWVLSMGIMIPSTILIALIPALHGAQHQQAAGIAILIGFYGSAFAVQALVKPVYGIALVLFYYDQRIRKEGYDIEWMMQRAGMVPEAPPTPEAAPWLAAAPQKLEATLSQPESDATLNQELGTGMHPPAGELE